MGLSYSENFDGVTAPAIPSGWNVDAVYVTNGTQFHSSPNALRANDNTNVFKWATYGTSDPLNGASINLSVYFYFPTSAVTSQFNYGVSYRCDAATMNNSSTRCYSVRIADNPGNGTGSIGIGTITNGTYTSISSLSIGIGSLSNLGWYLLQVICVSNAHTVNLQQQSNGFWLNNLGTFASPVASAISVSDSTYTTGNYYGIVSKSPAAGGGTSIYYDDFSIITPYSTGSLLRVPMDGLNRYSDLHGGMFG